MVAVKTIWKFPILGGLEQLPMPRGAKILHVGDQGGVIHLWAEVDTTAERVRRGVTVVGTGHAMHEGNGSYVGTVMQGEYVWHLYIEDETPDPARPS